MIAVFLGRAVMAWIVGERWSIQLFSLILAKAPGVPADIEFVPEANFHVCVLFEQTAGKRSERKRQTEIMRPADTGARTHAPT